MSADIDSTQLTPRQGGTNTQVNEDLGPLAQLIGTWSGNKGYNVIALPQNNNPSCYTLVFGEYYETITFSGISALVPNRGGQYDQNAATLFYEQKVHFKNGANAGQLEHAEDGSWLYLTTGKQVNVPLPDPLPSQPADISIVKQVCVPHGNSILAMGSSEVINGKPQIADVSTIPVNINKELIDKNIPGGVQAFLKPYQQDPRIVNPHIVLQQALQDQTISKTTILSVDTNNHGNVVNIPFIQNHADVSRYQTTFWLEEVVSASGKTTLQLQYSQQIDLNFNSEYGLDGKPILYPHIDANTLVKV
ncbi:hypothetical protein SG34_020345 [Thalassomonas viridans]|uniref:THAP4-like heme-binding beta-barrel domain-containing protein n=1 Tax=Thalassomonas viridans TaxID=137584 RepID=A0AAE9Z1X2_9GAMM|nr:heme-binding protein [Thalassomonas viridans]WDE03713.1 hypothetical protein SG34_020345 [Thalassomonas viridans]